MRNIKFLIPFIVTTVLLSCGPSPESMAKKNCELHKKFDEAQKNKDVMNILKYADEIKEMDNKILAEHKNNPDWVNTYVLERNACVLEAMKDSVK